MQQRRLFIIGTGGLAKEVAQIVNRLNRDDRWDVVGYIKDARSNITAQLPFFPVLGDDRWLEVETQGEADAVIAIGHPRVRRKVAEAYLAYDRFRFPNLIHPDVDFDFAVNTLGIGNVVARGVVVTTCTTIGSFNLLNLNSTIGHDAVIGSYNVINPSTNISGCVAIGDEILLGTGSVIIEGRSIASRATIGAGAVVVKDIPEGGGTFVGIPAKELR